MLTTTFKPRAAATLRWMLLALVTLFGTVACVGSVTQDVTLYDDNSYELIANLSLPMSAVALMGGNEAVKAQLNNLVQQAAAQGQALTWRELDASGGNQTYQL